MTLIEPLIHSHITDGLPDDHPKAWETVWCDGCPGEMLHCENNECMQTWVETGKGDYCLKCFAGLEWSTCLNEAYGLLV